MGVPAHDERDFEFARRTASPVRTVVRPDGASDASVGAQWSAELRRATASR